MSEAAEYAPGGMYESGPNTEPERDEPAIRTFPVIEIFGSTIQGEGALAGLPTLFVRFGGCDFRCSWCDSMYAVDPVEVRENAEHLPAQEIVDRCLRLVSHREGMWVTLSGGNPALMRFDREPMQYDFVGGMQRNGFKVAVETQGSKWRPWLATVDHLTVSPKPPSSGMVSSAHTRLLDLFLAQAKMMDARSRSLKIVVFNDDDYDWARHVVQIVTGDAPWSTYLSVGTDQEHVMDEHRTFAGIADRYRWLCEKVAVDPVFRNTKVLPQLHVIAFGTGRGV